MTELFYTIVRVLLVKIIIRLHKILIFLSVLLLNKAKLHIITYILYFLRFTVDTQDNECYSARYAVNDTGNKTKVSLLYVTNYYLNLNVKSEYSS